MTHSKNGFTLLELLVVVGIIGVLSALVLSALGNTRDRGSNAKIKQQMGSMKHQAELWSGAGTAFSVNTCAFTSGTLFETTNNGLGNLFAGLTLANMRCASATGLPSNGNQWAISNTLGNAGVFGV